MNTDDRIIFKPGKEQPITEEEHEQRRAPYEQHAKLLKCLSGWTKNAAKQLEDYGYSGNNFEENKVIFQKKVPYYDEETGNKFLVIYHYPGPIRKDATPAEKAACDVLKRANALWQALFSDNKKLIANLGISLGLAVAAAHATPFEELAITGDKIKNSYKNRADQHRKEDFQEWINNHPDRVRDITKKSDLRQIPELQRFFEHHQLDTIGYWFNEIYPNQFKSGRPKKPPVIP